jgi:hypothetical protein
MNESESRRARRGTIHRAGDEDAGRRGGDVAFEGVRVACEGGWAAAITRKAT